MKVIFYSSASKASLETLVVEAKADGFIEKAHDPDAFVRDVKRFL